MLRDLLSKAAVWIAERLPMEALTTLRERFEGDFNAPETGPAPETHIEQRLRVLERKAWMHDTLFYKAFSVAGFGEYLEFGVYQGASLCAAHNAAYEFYRQLSLDAEWGDLGGQVEKGRMGWAATRFIGFDSFQGIPPIKGPDAERPHFVEGEWAATEEQVWSMVDQMGIDREKVHLVAGFFENTCTSDTAKGLGLTEIAVAHIDSDIYESAKTALNFCTPYFRDGSVVIFDEWFQYRGSPKYGEQRAFGEWLSEHLEWHAAELGREAVGRIAFILTPSDG